MFTPNNCYIYLSFILFFFSICRLFQSFVSFGDAKCPNKTGIGLGLSICQSLIGLLGPEPKLNIESEIDKGSKFSFIIYQSIEEQKDTLTQLENNNNNILRPIQFAEQPIKSETVLSNNSPKAQTPIQSNFERSNIMPMHIAILDQQQSYKSASKTLRGPAKN